MSNMSLGYGRYDARFGPGSAGRRGRGWGSADEISQYLKGVICREQSMKSALSLAMFALATSRVDASCGANQYLTRASGVSVKSNIGGVACYGMGDTGYLGTNYCYWYGNKCSQHDTRAPSSRCKKFSHAVSAGWLTCVNKAQCESTLCLDTQIVVAGKYCSTNTCDAGDADTCCTLSCEAREQEWLADCACTADSTECTTKKTDWTNNGCEPQTCG